MQKTASVGLSHSFDLKNESDFGFRSFFVQTG